MYCNRNININWWPFCSICMLQTCIVCVFRWLNFSPSNHNSNLCHHLNNIVQCRATTCSPQFVVEYQGWPYVDSDSALKYHIIGNFCLHSSMGVSEGCGVSEFDCILPAACTRGNYWGSAVLVSTKWVNYWSYILDLSDTWKNKGNTMRQCVELKEAHDSVRWEVLYNILIEFGIPMKW